MPQLAHTYFGRFLCQQMAGEDGLPFAEFLRGIGNGLIGGLRGINLPFLTCAIFGARYEGQSFLLVKAGLISSCAPVLHQGFSVALLLCVPGLQRRQFFLGLAGLIAGQTFLCERGFNRAAALAKGIQY